MLSLTLDGITNHERRSRSCYSRAETRADRRSSKDFRTSGTVIQRSFALHDWVTQDFTISLSSQVKPLDDMPRISRYAYLCEHEPMCLLSLIG